MSLIVLGIDPGFASCGWASLRLERGVPPTLVSAGTIRTRPAGRKRALFAADDLWQRGEGLRLGLLGPIIKDHPEVICAESYSPVRSSSVAHQLGRVWGVLQVLAADAGLPVLQVAPQQVRERLLGRRAASKEEVRAVVATRLALPESCTEHEADAAAVVLACEQHSLIVGLRKRDHA